MKNKAYSFSSFAQNGNGKYRNIKSLVSCHTLLQINHFIFISLEFPNIKLIIIMHMTRLFKQRISSASTYLTQIFSRYAQK